LLVVIAGCLVQKLSLQGLQHDPANRRVMLENLTGLTHNISRGGCQFGKKIMKGSRKH
jgi:hypothetical protein